MRQPYDVGACGCDGRDRVEPHQAGWGSAEAARPGTLQPDMTELPSIWVAGDNRPLYSSTHTHTHTHIGGLSITGEYRSTLLRLSRVREYCATRSEAKRDLVPPLPTRSLPAWNSWLQHSGPHITHHPTIWFLFRLGYTPSYPLFVRPSPPPQPCPAASTPSIATGSENVPTLSSATSLLRPNQPLRNPPRPNPPAMLASPLRPHLQCRNRVCHNLNPSARSSCPVWSPRKTTFAIAVPP